MFLNCLVLSGIASLWQPWNSGPVRAGVFAGREQKLPCADCSGDGVP